MFEYLVEKIPTNDVARATSAMNLRGGQGWKAIYFTPVSQDLVVVYIKEERLTANPVAPVKRKATTRKKKTTIKKPMGKIDESKGTTDPLAF